MLKRREAVKNVFVNMFLKVDKYLYWKNDIENETLFFFLDSKLKKFHAFSQMINYHEPSIVI